MLYMLMAVLSEAAPYVLAFATLYVMACCAYGIHCCFISKERVFWLALHSPAWSPGGLVARAFLFEELYESLAGISAFVRTTSREHAIPLTRGTWLEEVQMMTLGFRRRLSAVEVKADTTTFTLPDGAGVRYESAHVREAAEALDQVTV